MKTTMTFCLLLLATFSYGKGQKKKVLFIGNSYTYYNDLPKMVAELASSTGDTLVYDSYAPGGKNLEQHSTDATTLAKIDMGTWDYVVLQEQSQRPAFPIDQVEKEVFPFAKILNDRIKAKNPCGETIFYMTWGYKNGDKSNCGSYPPLCSFETMNDELRERYIIMADRNDAMLSPVGAVWRSIRATNPTLELYNPDESHPEIAGTYIAACTFYTTIFQNNPIAVTFTAGLTIADANSIKVATKKIVFDSLAKWKVGENDPTAAFNFTVTTGSKKVSFTNSSTLATSYLWDFGDGTKDLTTAPLHTYSTMGTYNVMLVAKVCNRTDTMRKTVNITGMGISEIADGNILLAAYPNPFQQNISLDLTLVNGISEVSIYNYLGANVYKVKHSSGLVKINLSNLAKGPYFIKIINSGELILTQGLLKQD